MPASKGGTKGVDIEGAQYVNDSDRRPSSHRCAPELRSAHDPRIEIVLFVSVS